MKKYLAIVIAMACLLGIFPKSSFAAEMPALSTCVAPTGTLKADHNSGIHGVPGDTNAYSGSDKVYTVSDNYAMQCFCPDSGNGIQTDWIKATEFTQEEIKVYTNQGYIYVPNGAAWGLSSTPYLAKNSSYTCKGNGGSGGSSSSSSSSNVGGASSTNNSTSGSVLGLATTGNSLFVLSVFIAGIASTLTGIVLRKKA